MEMKIEKVLSRGEGKDAQVLLVLVSVLGPAPPDDDVWVGMSMTAPRSVSAQGRTEWVESARPLTWDELDRLDTDRKPDTTPFGLDMGEDRRYWLARFDFTDHPNLLGWWSQWAQAQDGPAREKLNVTAWRSYVKRAPNSNGTETETFEPMPGPVTEPFTFSDVVVQPLFELGVLFVHGIGNHHVRETLVRWAEPIVRIWRERGFAIEAKSDDVQPADRQRVSRWALSHQLRNRTPIDGISQVVEEFAPPPDQSDDPLAPVKNLAPLTRPTGSTTVTSCAAIKTEETRFADLAPGMPSSALLRVSTVDASAVLRESHVLFAEAYWSRESFPPTWSELRHWLTTAIPIAVWARQERLFLTRPAEIRRFAKAALHTRHRFELFRVAVSAALWAVQIVTLPAAYTIGAVAAQIVLGLISVVAILPIPWLQRGIRAVVATLLGTLGQSFALQNSPIRRAAIVSAVTKELNWLSDKCHRVVVLSHSQGAEVIRRVCLEARREKVVRWYSFGAGIVPLNMLHPRSLARNDSKTLIFVNRLMLAIAATLLIVLALDMVPGLRVGTRALVAQGLQGVSWVAYAWMYVVGLAAIAVLALAMPPSITLKMRASFLPRWRDYFASEDPVPGGSFIDRFTKKLEQFKPEQRRIFNTRFGPLDHTSYFYNMEEFVAPIAMDLLHLLGAGGDKAREQGALDKAARRRDLRTWWNMMFSVLGLVACVAVGLWVAFGSAHRGAIWAEQARAAWSQDAGLWKGMELLWSSGVFGLVISDLWLPLVILLVLAAWWWLNQWISGRSEKALIQDLAAAARQPRP